MVAPNSTFFIKQGDRVPVIQEYLRNADGTAIDLTSSTVKFHLRDGAGNVVVNASASILDATNGKVEYDWAAPDTATAGTFYREWEATLPSGKTVTTPNYTDYPVQIAAQIS